MTRKKFIEAEGATCRNWNWSWSFINEQKKLVIFGAWDIEMQPDGSCVILDERDERGATGRKRPGYTQALEHICLVESGSYKLMTFPMTHGRKGEGGVGPGTIKRFVPQLTPKTLTKDKDGTKWYAS